MNYPYIFGVKFINYPYVWLFSTLCDKFKLYKSDRSLCPLCLCGSFHSLPQDCILEYILPTKPKRSH